MQMFDSLDGITKTVYENVQTADCFEKEKQNKNQKLIDSLLSKNNEAIISQVFC